VGPDVCKGGVVTLERAEAAKFLTRDFLNKASRIGNRCRFLIVGFAESQSTVRQFQFVVLKASVFPKGMLSVLS